MDKSPRTLNNSHTAICKFHTDHSHAILVTGIVHAFGRLAGGLVDEAQLNEELWSGTLAKRTVTQRHGRSPTSISL